MAKKAAEYAHPELLALYDALIATIPSAERKGATIPYTSLNGHMYSHLTPNGALALRLPPKPREQFLETYHTTLVEAYGIIQKEYVTVPASLLQQTDELQPYFAESYAYVQGLKPKPTKAAKQA